MLPATQSYTPSQINAARQSRLFRKAIDNKAKSLVIVELEPAPDAVQGAAPAAMAPIVWPVLPPDVPSYSGPIDRIIRETAEYFGMVKADLTSERRTMDIVRARHIGMYLAKMISHRSFPEIGRRFGDRDHSTVLHAVVKIERMLPKDDQIAFDVANLFEIITGIQQ